MFTMFTAATEVLTPPRFEVVNMRVNMGEHGEHDGSVSGVRNVKVTP